LTAQWWPWLDFRLQARVPATAFSPRPSVDGGILMIDRRTAPLLSQAEQHTYQDWVRTIFSGRGRTLQEVLAANGGLSRRDSTRFCVNHHLSPRALPRDLSAHQWVAAFKLRSGQ
jgi:23S rRNA (adenine-N6)-dimethyltransferase